VHDSSSIGSSSIGSIGSSSSNSIEVAGVTVVQLALGVVPVGVLHERSFYVVNTGARIWIRFDCKMIGWCLRWHCTQQQ
jgi:hypothetical protein